MTSMLTTPIYSTGRHTRIALHFCALLALLLVVACGNSVEPESTKLIGRWEGFVAYGSPPYPINGDLVLTIDENRMCEIDGTMSGSMLPLGECDFFFTGMLTVNVKNTALGEISLTRCRSGIDTIQVVGTMAGQFDLSGGHVLGTWQTNPGEAFTLNGDWGAMKKD